ncbi:hypothetical protein T4D_13934 [Trichinella pseudospiralis]|uniref:Uncharacterized protein n=1 Tax=Trichinella pseudospiralis TaxID=6337 RepID=A0A0V1FKJ6_TRIPS|nr:hypothetical protein T4D_13934 [Trichinella pseudospiralis]
MYLPPNAEDSLYDNGTRRRKTCLKFYEDFT